MGHNCIQLVRPPTVACDGRLHRDPLPPPIPPAPAAAAAPPAPHAPAAAAAAPCHHRAVWDSKRRGRGGRTAGSEQRCRRGVAAQVEFQAANFETIFFTFQVQGLKPNQALSSYETQLDSACTAPPRRSSR
jgi:hypothetical protein